MFRLPNYGHWSGQGWSNGENYGGRVLSDGELRRPGIDPYDNYVAKAHDLNEIFAAQDLRYALADASPVFADLRVKTPNGDFAEPLIFEASGGMFDPSRFVDPGYYLPMVRANERPAVAAAFYSYFDHVMRSNMQYAIDYAFNGVRFTGFASIAMQIQLGGASHYFMGEAVDLERRLVHLSQSGLVSSTHISSVPHTLFDRIVKPGHSSGRSSYISRLNTPFVQKATMETIVVADRDILRVRATDVIQQKNR